MTQAKLIDNFPTVTDRGSLILLMPQSMHAIRVPADEAGNAPWRHVLDSYPTLAEGRFEEPDLETWGVNLVTSHMCNMRCVYCFSEVASSKAALDLSRMLAMIDHAFDRPPDDCRGPFSVAFFGGEPTLYMSEVKRIVEHVKRRCASMGVQPRFHMVTNGTAPASEMEYLVGEGFELVVSMDSSPERQGKQRLYLPGAEVAHTESTIRLLAERNASFRVRSTVTSETVAYMDEAVHYFAGLGAPWIHFEPVGPSRAEARGKSGHYGTPAVESYADNFIRALDAAQVAGVGLFGYAYQHLLQAARSYCRPLSGDPHYFVLNATGEIVMCPEIQNSAQNARYGHIVGKVSPTGEVVVDLAKKSAIGDLARSAFHTSECHSCYARDICKSGCPSRNIQATGSLKKLDPYSCGVAKILCSEVLQRIARATFDSQPPARGPELRPLSLPLELCTPPMLRTAFAVLKRAFAYWSLTGHELAGPVLTELGRLASIQRLHDPESASSYLY